MNGRRLLAASVLPLAAAMTFLAATPWLRAFPPETVAPLFIAAAIVSVAIPPLVVAATGRSVVWSALTSVVVLFVFSLLVTLRDPTGTAALVRGFTQGVARLLSIALPVAEPRWLFVAPVVLTWIVGAVASELLTRSRVTGLPPLVGIVGFALAYAATAGAPGSMVAQAALLGLSAGILLFLRRWLIDTENTEASLVDAGASERSLARPLVLGTITLSIAAVICALLIPLLPPLQGAATSPSRTPPVVTVTPLAPTVGLAELRGQTGASGHAKTLFVVKMDQPSSGYLAAADLDLYDGDVWSLRHTFEPTGGGIRLATGAPSSSQHTSEVVQHYRVLNAPALPWMPYLDQPTAVSGVSVDFDDLSGMIIPTTPLKSGQSYTVTSTSTVQTLASLSAAQLHDLSVGTTADPADAVPLAGADQSFDNVLTQLESETGQTSGATLTFLAAVANDFAHNYRRVATSEYAPAPTKARSVVGSPTAVRPDLYGTSLADIQGAIFGKTKTGTPEQFATVMTLLCRKLGIPARMVTGYRLSGPNRAATTTTPGREYRVTNLDAWSWVEINVPSLGWVVVDPTPDKTGTVPAQPPVVAAPTTTLPPTQVHAAVIPSRSGHAVAPRVSVSLAKPSHVWPIVVGIIAIALILIAGIPAWAEAMKARRKRRRRSAPGAGRQVEGAWLETLDVLREADVSGLEPLTNSEVAAMVAERFGPNVGEPVGVIAASASEATFSSAPLVDDDESWTAWREFEEFRSALGASQTFGERVRSHLRIAPRQVVDEPVRN